MPIPPSSLGATAAMETVFTMCAGVLARRCGRKARTPRTTPCTFTSKSHDQSASVASASGPIVITPALLTSTWTAPNASMVASARLSRSSALVTSVRRANRRVARAPE